MCSPSASRTSSTASISASASDNDCGSALMPSFGELGVVRSRTVAVRLVGKLVTFVDALHAGGEHHAERQVRIAHRVGRAVLDAGGGRLPFFAIGTRISADCDCCGPN